MKFRRPLSITSRTSSITNCFVQAIIPNVESSSEEVGEALMILSMTLDNLSCVYCGARTTDWDHLRPLVKNRRPTGYITEIRNLVPACGPCNQSKGGSDWKAWMESAAPGSPKTRRVRDLLARIELLHRFEKWGALSPVPLADLATEKLWADHWKNLDVVLDAMKKAQAHADQVRTAIRNNIADLKTTAL
jgi:hypothetical protein